MRKLDFTIFTTDQLIDFHDMLYSFCNDFAPDAMYWDDPRFVMLRDIMSNIADEIDHRLWPAFRGPLGVE